MNSVHVVVLSALVLCYAGTVESEGCRTDDECEDYEACFPSEGVCGDLWVNCHVPEQCAEGETCTIRNHEVVCLRNQTECHLHGDCSVNKMCISNTCLDPCLNNICGKNTTCRVRDREMFCDCLPGHVRVNPAAVTSACRVPDCVKDADCNDDKVCRQGRCQISVCASKCGPNTECIVTIDNSAVCVCKPGYNGNPSDTRKGRQQECVTHSDCPDTEMCMLHQCRDPCEHMGCGVNTSCVTVNHFHTTCPCLPGFLRLDPSIATSACGRGDRGDVDTLGNDDTPSNGQIRTPELDVDLQLKAGVWYEGLVREWSFSVHTRDESVELAGLKCEVLSGGNFTLNTTIASQSHTTTLSHSALSTDYLEFIPVSAVEKPVVLSPHTLYTVSVSCDTEFELLRLPSPRFTERHFDLRFPPLSGKYYSSPVSYISYKT